MSNSNSWNAGVSNLLKNIYHCADKSKWYDSVSEAYERTRPRYPQQILAQIQANAQLKPGKSVLEIGSGPAIASVELAKLGVNLVCLEPSQAACKIARRKCSAYPQVKVINTTFEAWELAEQKFDAVVATTSFHWVSPEIRTQKAAAALKKHGKLILMWNTPPQPSYEVYQSLAHIYQELAPELARYEGHQHHEQNLAYFGEEIIESGCFENLITDKIISRVSYSVDDYLTLLSTLSPYIGLEPEVRSQLFKSMEQLLKLNYGEQLELQYLSLVQIAEKNSDY
ncbi:MAG: class I SAM-dependent methyltransferase [Cyanobacteria bacterium J06621_8]